MKIIHNLSRLSFVFFLMMMYSCIGLRDYGPIITETRKVSGFDAIEVSHGIDLHLTMDTKERMEVEVPEDLAEHLVTEVDDGRLRIYFDRSFNWNNRTKVFVSAKKIESIKSSGGSDVKGENTIDVRDLELKASGGSDIKLEVAARELSVHVSGGADVDLTGETDFIYANTSGGSDLRAYDLIAEIAELEASGGSDIKITVKEEIEAKASGGADIVYKGNPTVKDTNTSSGADIKQFN